MEHSEEEGEANIITSSHVYAATSNLHQQSFDNKDNKFGSSPQLLPQIDHISDQLEHNEIIVSKENLDNLQNNEDEPQISLNSKNSDIDQTLSNNGSQSPLSEQSNKDALLSNKEKNPLNDIFGDSDEENYGMEAGQQIITTSTLSQEDHTIKLFNNEEEIRSDEDNASFEGFRDSEIEQEAEGCSAYYTKSESKKHKKHHRKNRKRHREPGVSDDENSSNLDSRQLVEREGDLTEEYNPIEELAQENSDASGDDVNEVKPKVDILPALTDEEDDSSANEKRGKHKKRLSQGAEDEDDILQSSGLTDFDIMMERKKAEGRRARAKRKRLSYYSSASGGGGDFINDADDMISALLDRMKMAWEEDRISNSKKEPAYKKLRLLPTVIANVRRIDLQGAFLDSGILAAFSDWLQPLPDKSLPHFQIREEVLKVLLELPPVDVSVLKSSLIGKAVMYLYKHPKETKQNKIMAGRLINEWSRTIFNIPADLKAMSKEEREERDYYLQNHFKQQAALSAANPNSHSRSKTAAIDGSVATADGEDGDPKFVGGKFGRARIPQPSAKDYVIRPKSKINIAEINQKRPLSSIKNSRMEKWKKMMNTQKVTNQNKNRRSVGISLEGRKMAL